jgi:PAS domain S-box-containing protein
MEYPCAEPERERWFKLQIARFVVRGAVRVTVTHTDITENRQAVDRAIRSETRMRALLDCSTEIELLLDGEGRILYATPAIERVTGRTAELLIGHSNLDLVHSPDRGQAIVALNGGPGSSDPRRYRVRHSDGSLHWVEATIRNLLFDPEVRALVVNLRSLMSNVAG